jgi:hypothetical protein
MRATWILGGSAVLLFTALPICAQPVVAAKSGTISVADGKVFLDDKPLEIQPGQFPDVKEKSVLRTEDGRAEVLLPPGMFLRIGENSSIRMVSSRLVDTRVELLGGSGVLEIDATSKDSQVTMIEKDGTVTFTKGIYRFDSQPARLKVYDGNADVQIAGRSVTVPTGKMIGLTGDTASVEKFDLNDTDSLDHWSRRRGEELAMANVSAAKRAQGNTWSASINPCMGYGPYGGFGPYGYGPASYAMGTGGPYGVWAYNPWYGMYTYMPCSGMFMSPYGYNYFSPLTVGRLLYNGAPIFGRGSGGGVLGTTAGRTTTASRPGLSYSSVGSVARGYSGVLGASSAAGAVGAGAAAGGGGFGGGHAGGFGGGVGGGGHAGGTGGGGGGGGHGR